VALGRRRAASRSPDSMWLTRLTKGPQSGGVASVQRIATPSPPGIRRVVPAVLAMEVGAVVEALRGVTPWALGDHVIPSTRRECAHVVLLSNNQYLPGDSWLPQGGPDARWQPALLQRRQAILSLMGTSTSRNTPVGAGDRRGQGSSKRHRGEGCACWAAVVGHRHRRGAQTPGGSGARWPCSVSAASSWPVVIGAVMAGPAGSCGVDHQP